MARFFVDPSQIEDNKIKITGQDVRHIRDVLRLVTGDQIIICDGEGIDYPSLITQIEKEYIITKVADKMIAGSEPKTSLTLFQSLIKGNKFEWVIQKAVEIGVQKIVPIETAHCVVKMNNPKKTAAKVNRWNKIAQSAAKQSGRGRIPLVSDPISYESALDLCQEMDFSCIAYEKEASTNLKPSIQALGNKKIGILVGPEGGFSEEEVASAQAATIQPITLGPRILRSETASIVLVSNILYELGEMDL